MDGRGATTAMGIDTQLLLRSHTETVVKLHVADERVELEGASVAGANLDLKDAGDEPTPEDIEPVTGSDEEDFHETQEQFDMNPGPPARGHQPQCEPEQYQSPPFFFSRLRTFFLGRTTPGGAQSPAKAPEGSPAKGKAGETDAERLAPPTSHGPSTPSKRQRTLGSDVVTGTPPVGPERTSGVEVYYPSDLAKLGSCQEPWDLEDPQTQADTHRARCHQCGDKVARHSECSQCQREKGRICGDCLYARYGENLNEVDRNPQWVCPVCRDICNCFLCRMDKGWSSFAPPYEVAKARGFPSVAHYLITTKQVGNSPHGDLLFDALMDIAPSTSNLAPEARVPSVGGHLAARPEPRASGLQPRTPAHAAPAPGTAGNAITPLPLPPTELEGDPAAPGPGEGAPCRAETAGAVSQLALHVTTRSTVYDNAMPQFSPGDSARATSIPSGPASPAPGPQVPVDAVVSALAAMAVVTSGPAGPVAPAPVPSKPVATTSAAVTPLAPGVPTPTAREPLAPSPAAVGPQGLEVQRCAVPEASPGKVLGVLATGVAEPNVAQRDGAGHGMAGPGPAAQGRMQSTGMGAGGPRGARPDGGEAEGSEELPRGTPQLGSPMEKAGEAKRAGTVGLPANGTVERGGGAHSPTEHGVVFTDDAQKAADDATGKSDCQTPGDSYRTTPPAGRRTAADTPGGGHRTTPLAGLGTAADAGNTSKKQAGNRSKALEISRLKCTYPRVETLDKLEAASPPEVPQTAGRKRARGLEGDFQAAVGAVGTKERAVAHSQGEAGGTGEGGARVRSKLSEAAKLLQTNLRSGGPEEPVRAGPTVERPATSRKEQQGPKKETKGATLGLISHKKGARSASKGRGRPAPNGSGSGMPKPSQARSRAGRGGKAGRGRPTVQACTSGRAGGTGHATQGGVGHPAPEVAKLCRTFLRVERLEEPKGVVPTVRVTRSMCTGPRYVGPGQWRQETDLEQAGNSHELRDTAAWGAGRGRGRREEGVGQSGDATGTLRAQRGQARHGGQRAAQEEFRAPKAPAVRHEKRALKELVQLAPTLLRDEPPEEPRSVSPVVRMTRAKGTASGHEVAKEGTRRPVGHTGHARSMLSDDAARARGRPCDEVLSDCGSKAEHGGSIASRGQGDPGKQEVGSAAEELSSCQV